VNLKPSALRATATLAVAVVLSSCTNAALEKPAAATGSLDNHLTLTGRICTQPPDPGGFPVKVLFLVDQSGSMCISDPPGSQGAPGLCEQLVAMGIVPANLTTPARVRAMQQLLAQFQTENAAGANISVAIVPYATNIQNPYPSVGSAQGFATPSGLDGYLGALQGQLGKGTDYQGAIAYAYSVISGDVAATSVNNPQLLPRTRYVVVWLTDGTPYPRCSAIDNLPVYADPQHPYLIWADSVPDYCNTAGAAGNDAINGFVVGTDRNQNYQIFSYVDQLMSLKTTYNIGDIRLHTVLLFNQAAVQACGTICEDIYGVYPNTPVAGYPAAAHLVAEWLLTQIALLGNGVYQEFLDGNIQNLGLGALDYSSLASRNVLKSLIVQSLRSEPAVTMRKVDSDGDGLTDDADQPYLYAGSELSPYEPDSNQDGFSDRFEVLHIGEGFHPGSPTKDLRGCNPLLTATLGCKYFEDSDGDGLTTWEEAYLGTRSNLVDSDGDGIPDGIEARYGLDPLVSNNGMDSDSDGISDLDEIRGGTDPSTPDRSLYDSSAIQYTFVATPQADNSVCYDYSVSGIELVTPPNNVGNTEGYNLFKVWFAEAPESAVASDYGVWKVACAWAQYAPALGATTGVRVPAGPSLPVNDANFLLPPQLVLPSDYLGNKCVGAPPQ
jgi:Bacterial TSP3 repeat